MTLILSLISQLLTPDLPRCKRLSFRFCFIFFFYYYYFTYMESKKGGTRCERGHRSTRAPGIAKRVKRAVLRKYRRIDQRLTSGDKRR